MNDEKQVLEELEQLKKKASVWTACTVICFILVFASFMIGRLNLGVAAVPMFAIIVICGILAGKKNKEYQAYYKEHVVKNMTLDECEFLEDVSFDPNSGISRYEIEDLGVLRCDEYSSNDLITATYKGVAFRQSDVHMVDVTTDSKGNRSESTVFRGRWLVFDFNKDFNWNLELISKGFYSARRIGGVLSFGQTKTERVKLEDETFNKTFKVYAENEHEAFYILTPHIMQSILQLKEQLKAPILLTFAGGRLHIGVYNGKDAFEGKIFGKIDLEAEKQRMFEDLRLITNFVDELSLERDIYKH
ncbi:MAG: DUF3137 domain-containing protein [Bacillota bacterium]|nr:DUF3137 domain-containing protein [Bacillota bacterium]